MFLGDAASHAGSPLAEAWRLSGVFWRQTLIAFARHPVILLLYAAPPATERAWLLIRTKSVPAWWLPTLEAFVAVWRLLMCAIAVWILLTPPQMRALRATLASNAQVQEALYHLGRNIGKQLWLLLWEIVLFAAAFLILSWLFGRMARLWVRGQDMALDQMDNQRLALASVARNLLLVPLALMYVTAVIRHILA